MRVVILLDMIHASANVNGNSIITLIIAHGGDNISMDVFNDPDARTVEPTSINASRNCAKKLARDTHIDTLKSVQLAKTATTESL